jgi:GT2 family glycosyltransferase
MKIAAIVPQWNRSDLLRNLLSNLARQTRPFDQIIVVDNGSSDDSVSVGREAGARVIELGRNTGFAGAVNRGVASCQSDWVAILNNDVLLEPDWLAVLESHFAAADFLCGKLLSAANPKILDGTFDELAASACACRCGAGKPDGPEWQEIRPIRFAPMTAAVFRRSLFTEIGPLDESFESYLEDVDFGVRCALAGKSGVFVPAARGTHQGSATSGAWHSNTVRLISRNQMLLSFKYFQGLALWPRMAGQLLWGLVALRHGRLAAWLRGKWQGWGHRQNTSTQRHPRSMAEILDQSEQTIRDVQRRTGFDPYWRLYFWLRGR